MALSHRPKEGRWSNPRTGGRITCGPWQRMLPLAWLIYDRREDRRSRMRKKGEPLPTRCLGGYERRRRKTSIIMIMAFFFIPLLLYLPLKYTKMKPSFGGGNASREKHSKKPPVWQTFFSLDMRCFLGLNFETDRSCLIFLLFFPFSRGQERYFDSLCYSLELLTTLLALFQPFQFILLLFWK